MTLRRVVISLGVLAGILVVVIGGAMIWLLTADLRPWIEDYASKSIGRPVVIGTLKIGWGNPLSLEITDLKVANAPWGSVPDMISVDGISALVDPWSLLGGVPKFQKLHAVKPVIVLERDKDGTGNWKFAGKANPPAAPVMANPQSRRSFPTLLDLALQDGLLTYKGLGSYRLKLDLHDVTIQTTGEDQPVKLAAAGAHNGTPVTLSGDVDSFRAFRDTSRPFATNLTLAAASSTMIFKGTIVDPLDFEGVEGPLTIDSAKLGDLLKVFGADIGLNPPLLLAGTFKHDGDHWEMTKSTGKIATSNFEGDLFFDEGPRSGQDNLVAKLRFNALDLNPILPAPGKVTAATPGLDAVSLRLDPKPGTNVDADVVAQQLTYAKTRIANFSIHMKMLAGQLNLSRLNFALAGGTIDASGTAATVAGGTRIQARGLLTGADAAQLAAYVDALAGKLRGQVESAFAMDMTGETLGNALRAGHGHAVAGMVQGSISRDLMEKLSTNLLNLFRNGEGTVPVACLLGIVDLRNGLATISPLRLRSGDGTVIGRGQVDIPGKRLDITIQSESSTTGFFALDIPIRIHGSFGKPNIDPQIGGGGAASRQALTNNNPTQNLSPELKALAERNPCLH